MSEQVDIRWKMDPEAAGMRREVLLEGPAFLEREMEEGRHKGAQTAISRHGRLVVEYALGEAAPGVPMTPDSLTAWFSASKPVTAMAIALLYDRGLLALDDPVQRHIPEFGNGKEACTIRHVLTHTGGFPGAIHADNGQGWDELIAAICAHPAEYPPGAQAGYHAASGWYVLGEIVRRLDGRSIDVFAAEDIFAPLGIDESAMGIPPERQRDLGGRLARVQLGHTNRAHFATQEFIDRFNSVGEIARVNPSGGMRGPARELARLFDWLLAKGEWEGRQLVDRRTVELFTSCHRWGMPDQTLMGAPLAWGLGFGLHGNADIHRDYSRRVFSHSGMVSTVALGDPVSGIACAVVTTGLLDPMTNARRLREVTGTAIRAIQAE